MTSKTLRSKSTRFEKLSQVDLKSFAKQGFQPQEKTRIEKKKREVFRIERPNPSPPNYTLLNEIYQWIDRSDNLYLGFGGTGDALLLLASCWNDPNANPVFFANAPSINLIKQFFELFKINALLKHNIMGQTIAGEIFSIITKHPNFKESAHLADGLYFGDWVDEDKYAKRIKSSVPWKDEIGIHKTNKKSIVICPSGSDRTMGRQRFITHKEYRKLAERYMNEDFLVFFVGSEQDFKYYHFKENVPVTWLTSTKSLSYNNQGPMNLKSMLQVINSATEVISVDTWVKTYSLLAGLPTKVIKTRWNGNYLPYGRDVTDFVFLSKKIWKKIEFVEIEDLI